MAANCVQYWNSPESVALFGAAPFLYTGEQLALAALRERIRGHAVLDLACGAGRTTHFLSEMGANVIGVDIAANLIEVARRRFAQIDFRVGDATALDFPDETFDVVLVAFNSFDCLYPKAVRMRSLAEVHRVLRPGGDLLFSHHNSAALLFGWHGLMGPRKIAYRLKRILSAEALRPECYMPELTVPAMRTYYAWPRRIVADLERAGFESRAVFPNAPLLARLQALLRTDALTRLCDPWPYQLCRKRPVAANASGAVQDPGTTVAQLATSRPQTSSTMQLLTNTRTPLNR